MRRTLSFLHKNFSVKSSWFVSSSWLLCRNRAYPNTRTFHKTGLPARLAAEFCLVCKNPIHLYTNSLTERDTNQNSLPEPTNSTSYRIGPNIEALTEQSNVVCKTFGICLSSKVLNVWPRHNYTSRIRCAMFLNNFWEKFFWMSQVKNICRALFYSMAKQ